MHDVGGPWPQDGTATKRGGLRVFVGVHIDITDASTVGWWAVYDQHILRV